MVKFSELLNILKEKEKLTLIVSLVITPVIISVLPDFLDIKKNLGKSVYHAFIFLLTFLLCTAVKEACSKVKNKQVERKKRLEQEAAAKQKDLENEKETMEKLWDYVDSLDSRDTDMIERFLKSNNDIITVAYDADMSELLKNKRMVVCTKFKGKQCLDPQYIRKFGKYPCYIMTPDSAIQDYPIKAFKLRDEAYNALKISFEKYHRISHFRTINKAGDIHDETLTNSKAVDETYETPKA